MAETLPINAGEKTKIEKSRIELSRPQTRVRRARQPLVLDMAGQRAGKSEMIGVCTGEYVQKYPKLKGFIGANTYMQLTQSTLLKATEVWDSLFGMTPWDAKTNPDGWYVMDKRPPKHFKQYQVFKSYDNIISFKNGHVIYTGSLDNYKAHDGKEFAYAHLDETKDTKEEALKVVIMARLSQQGLFIDADGKTLHYCPDYDKLPPPAGATPFNPITIHTSPAVGQVDWLIKLFDLAKYEQEIMQRITKVDDFFHKVVDGRDITIYSTYHNLKNLPANYIENRLRVLSENEGLKFVFGYPFSKTGGEFYEKFERRNSVTKVNYIPGLNVHMTWDFNVLPYMTALCCQIQEVTRFKNAAGQKFREQVPGTVPVQVEQVRFYREYCFESPRNSSEAICNQFKAEHEFDMQNITVFTYGDASGRKRFEGLGGITNYSLIEQYLIGWLNNNSDRVPGVNPNVLRRRDLLNRIYEGKYDIEVVFDESLEFTIRDMEFLKLGADGKLKEIIKDKLTGQTYQKLGHTSDAVDYIIFYLYGHLLNENG